MYWIRFSLERKEERGKIKEKGVRMKKSVILLIFFTSSSLLFGWGKGHDDQMHLVLKLLPPEIRNFFPDEMKVKIIKKYSHYPDSFKEIDPDILTEQDKKLIERFNIKVRFGLHKAEGMCISFILMTEGFREKNVKKAAVFMCALTHVLGDLSACNHAPLVHILTYGFSQYKIKKGKGLLDFSQVKDEKLIAGLTKNFNVRKISDNPEDVLFDIMLSGVKLNSYMTMRDTLIAKTFNYKLSEKEKKEGLKALAELGVKGSELSASLVYTSYLYAKEGKIPVLKKELLEKYKKAKEKYLMEKPLSYDSIYQDVIEKKHKYPAAGVLVEPSGRLNEGYFSFSSKLIQSAIMRVLKKEKIPYACLDVREMIKGKKIDREKIPVLIICSGNFSVPEKVMKGMKEYSEKGGKIIWIGGKDKGLLGSLSNYLKVIDDKYLPVTKEYGNLHKEVIGKIDVYFENELETVFGDKPYRFVNNPNTPAGWQRPYCNLTISEKAKDVKVLAKIKIGEKNFNVAGYYNSEGKPFDIFVPEYLISPFLLVNVDTSDYDFSRPVLDSVGSRIIISLVNILFPQSSKSLCR